MKRALFRLDSSKQIGSGHLVRCLTLARGLRRAGWNCDFVSRQLDGNMNSLIAQDGFGLYELQPPAAIYSKSWLGASLEEDALECRAYLVQQDFVYDLLVIDHYELDASWVHALNRGTPLVAKKILVVDDLGDRKQECDLLMNQGFVPGPGAPRYEGLVPDRCKLLLGPKYALLREEFATFPRLQGKQGSANRILVFFGAVDAANQTAKVFEALQELRAQSGDSVSNFEADIVVGLENQHQSELSRFASKSPWAVIHTGFVSMATLMSKATLFIGAGGTTTWERCFFALPSIVITIADNQVQSTEALARDGKLIYLGPHQTVTASQIVDQVASCLNNREATREMGRQSSELVDGQGANRVIREICSLG